MSNEEMKDFFTKLVDARPKVAYEIISKMLSRETLNLSPAESRLFRWDCDDLYKDHLLNPRQKGISEGDDNTSS